MSIQMHDSEIPMWIRTYPSGIAIYRAGMAAGIERAAKVCDRDGSDNSEYFAAAIWALLK